MHLTHQTLAQWPLEENSLVILTPEPLHACETRLNYDMRILKHIQTLKCNVR